MVDRQGVVFIAADVHYGSSEVHLEGYWDRDQRSEIEQMPEMRCAADAIALEVRFC